MHEGEGVRRLRLEVQVCLSNAERALNGQQPIYTNGHATTNGTGGSALLLWPLVAIPFLAPHHRMPSSTL